MSTCWPVCLMSCLYLVMSISDMSNFWHVDQVSVEGVEGGTLYPGVDCPPLPKANIDYVHRDKIGEIVSSILLKSFQKLQITRLFSFPLS